MDSSQSIQKVIQFHTFTHSANFIISFVQIIMVLDFLCGSQHNGSMGFFSPQPGTNAYTSLILGWFLCPVILWDLIITIHNCTYAYIYIFFSFYSHTHSIWKFLERSNWSCSCRPTLQSQQYQIRAASATNATAGSNARSITHWGSPRSEPASS